MLGTVKSYNPATFSGTIACESTGEVVSFTGSALMNKEAGLQCGQKVSFYVEQGSQGKKQPVATRVTPVA